MRIAFCTVGNWHKSLFGLLKQNKAHKWMLVKPEDGLEKSLLVFKPDFVFFFRWHSVIPKQIVERFVCIGFHPTNLPFGRGGSPLQNLLLKGIYRTKLSAFRITERLDEGPVYLKRNFDLSSGSCQFLYDYMGLVNAEMMLEIIENGLKPVPQKGRVVVFKRRVPSQSELPSNLGLRNFFDFVRMLDGEDYPKAFLNLGGLRLEFSEAALKTNCVEAKVVTRKEAGKQ